MDDDIKVQMAEVKRDLENWQANTLDYRKLLDNRIDMISQEVKEVIIKLYDLPCKERRGWYASMTKQMAFMWGAIVAIIVFGAKHLWGM